MSKRPKKNQKAQTKLQELVIVTLVDDVDQARDYETLLKNNDIPVIIREQTTDPAAAKGIAVMVPEDFLDEANVVIESVDAYEDFYDYALDDEQNDDFDTGILDSDF